MITCFISFWLHFVSKARARKLSKVGAKHRRKFVPSTTTLVFTHQDLAPRNMMIGTDGNLWLLDWERAGFYPRYFEPVSMQNFLMPSSWNRMARLRWWLFSWISTEEVLERARWNFLRYQVGRKEAVLLLEARFDTTNLRKPGM